jgi:hypothetical protein
MAADVRDETDGLKKEGRLLAIRSRGETAQTININHVCKYFFRVKLVHL